MTDSEIFKEYLKKSEEEEILKPKKVRKTVEFKIKEVTDTDFTLEKGTNRFLFHPSEDIYAIEKKGKREDVREMTDSMFLAFFRGCPDSLDIQNFIFQGIKRSEWKEVKQMIDCYSRDLKEKYMTFPLYQKRDQFPAESREVRAFLISNTPFLSRMNETESMERSPKYGKVLFGLLNFLNREMETDAMKTFGMEYLKSSMTGFIMERWKNTELELSLKVSGIATLPIEDTAEYLCYTLYEQGYESIPIHKYLDYLYQQTVLYGIIKNPYPESLDTGYQRIRSITQSSGNRNGIDLWMTTKVITSSERETLKDHYLDFLKTTDAVPNSEVAVPENPETIVEYGMDLGFDLRPEINFCIQNPAMILFQRKEEKINLWLLLEKKEDHYELTKAEGKYRRTTLTKEEKNILDRFSAETGVLLSLS